MAGFRLQLMRSPLAVLAMVVNATSSTAKPKQLTLLCPVVLIPRRQ